MEKVVDKFSDEQEILDSYINGEFSAKDIVSELLSDEVKERYKEYCSEHNLQDTEEAAAAFMDWWYSEDNDREPTSDELLEEENASNEDASQDAPDIFSEWNKDSNKILALSSSESAREITLWRWKNPTETDKQKCVKDIDVPIADVEMWWNTPDWINGYVGGHFHPQKMDKKELKSFLFKACTETMGAYI